MHIILKLHTLFTRSELHKFSVLTLEKSIPPCLYIFEKFDKKCTWFWNFHKQISFRSELIFFYNKMVFRIFKNDKKEKLKFLEQYSFDFADVLKMLLRPTMHT